MAAKLGALLFLIMGLAHFARYYQELGVTVGDMSIPLDWSLYAGGVLLVMTLWLWVSAR